ncbi:uncharacterized protein KGF55_005412 [Candida pseudojiufengensis]|uniref:uncharacterized protein n=1 Tax=Candida pseudojiufengensis TaxID=497109 RepID=UPI0022251873|nr:uncharacterized protein KGF55_005412 [Candida pseudojiufengensis]KAI5959262.1 hypothetical protein KGF55_005412 [Candida pseudojiufengensis]
MSATTQTQPPVESVVPGLSTPHLNNAEANPELDPSNTSTTEKKPTIFDITHEIEQQLNNSLDSLEKNQKEMNHKIDSIMQTITNLQKST